MKAYLFFILLICNSLHAQNNFNFGNLKTGNQNNLLNSHIISQENLVRTEESDSIQQVINFFGFTSGDNFGYPVASAGDVNGDGYSDFIISAFGYNYNMGRVYIYFGGSVLNNVADVILTGEYTWTLFGYSVSGAGDVNGDGYSDVIVSAKDYDTNTGRAYIYYGGASMDTIADIVIIGESVNNNFGISVASAEDLNGDGYSDVIIGANKYNSSTGRAYIYFGGSSMNNVPDVIINGEAESYNLGFAVSGAGDVNGDGYFDVVAGAYGHNSNTGKAYIYYGGIVMDNIADVIMTGESQNSYFGYTFSEGDLNRDGYSDVIVSAEAYDGNTGRVYIYFGGVSMDNVADVVMTGMHTYSSFGISISSDDVNGDLFSDVIIGAYGVNSNKGESYTFYGGSSMDNVVDYTISGETADERFGNSVSSAGDINNDGVSDILIGAYGYNGFMGKAYLFIPLSTVNLIHPTNNSIDNIPTINFTWFRKPGTVSYRLIVSTDSLFNNIIINDSLLLDSFKTISNLNFATKYYWKVGAKDSNDNVSYSPNWNFTTIDHLPVILLNPQNSSTSNPLTINFNWNQRPATLSYRILISLDSLYNNIIFIDSIFNDTSLQISGFSYSTNYYWKVGAKDTSGITYFSPSWRFSTLSRPLVTLSSPLNNSINSPLNILFTWNRVPYASSYRLQIATDSNFNNLIRNYSGITDSFRTVNGFNHLTKYYWRIGARDNSSLTYYSPNYTFTTMPQLTLSVTVLMEGMYFPLFNILSRKDTVQVVLRETFTPYSIVDSSFALLDSLNYTGSFTFPTASSGRYYIVFKHFNSIDTWSKNGGEDLAGGVTNTYNFTTSISQAYGNNMRLIGSTYCTYIGDVTQDGFITLNDVISIYNNSVNFVTGNYLPADLNGDMNVDLSDVTLCYNNTINFIRVRQP